MGKLEEIAEKARKEPTLRFTSLAHHITEELLWKSLCGIKPNSSPGIDNTTVREAKDSFPLWAEKMIQTVHHKGYKPPEIRRCWIPKPGKQEKRPIGLPTTADKTLQKSVSDLLTTIYEQDFLNCSFGGRPGRGCHQALATFNEVISGKKVNYVYEADLKNFFGSLSHEWLIKFVEHRIGDPRIIELIKRWLKAGVVEENETTIPECGTPQGGNISVLLSNIYLHYVLDLWFEKSVKPKLKGESYLIRYIDDFLVCFQYKEDAAHFQDILKKRLSKFSLTLEPDKTRLIKFGRFAKQDVKGNEKVETVYFLGFTHYCCPAHKGGFRLGRKTEKTRFKRSVGNMTKLIKQIMHEPIKEQVKKINQSLRGHYGYYGLGGNTESLNRIYRLIERRWREMLSKRSWKSYISWDKYHKLKRLFPILRPKLFLPYRGMKAMVIL